MNNFVIVTMVFFLIRVFTLIVQFHGSYLLHHVNDIGLQGANNMHLNFYYKIKQAILTYLLFVLLNNFT